MNYKKSELEFHAIATNTTPSIPMAEANVHAGFPNPIDDAYMSPPIDLNKELVKNPASSYIVRVIGDSMIEEGIDEGDLLIVDRSVFATEKDIVVCMIDGEFALKHIVRHEGKLLLKAGNRKYKSILVNNPGDLRIFGVVQWVLKHK